MARKLHEVLLEHSRGNRDLVLACSALKQVYRDRLSEGMSVTWVYLKGSPENIRKRLLARHGHFATEKLLASQISALEEPQGVITVDADRDENVVVDEIVCELPKS